MKKEGGGQHIMKWIKGLHEVYRTAFKNLHWLIACINLSMAVPNATMIYQYLTVRHIAISNQ